MKRLLLLILFPVSLFAGEPHTYVPDPDTAIQHRIEEWQDLKFGLLMHWGTYSQWGIVESWSICPEDSEWCRRLGPDGGNYAAYKASYEGLKRTFNPVRFAPRSPGASPTIRRGLAGLPNDGTGALCHEGSRARAASRNATSRAHLGQSLGPAILPDARLDGRCSVLPVRGGCLSG